MDVWNPWHGCHMLSPGCQNCYVYRRDRSVGRDAGQVRKTADFDLPLRRGRDGAYKLRGGREVFARLFPVILTDIIRNPALSGISDAA